MKSINLASIDLNLLVTFEALLEERSVTGAARRLNLGQPAMSAALGRLRSLFGDELFVRIGKEMRPTSKATELAPGIVAALRQIRQTVEASRTFDPTSVEQSFRISSSDYTSFVVVPPLLDFCHQTAPSLDLRIIEFEKDSVSQLLEQGGIDVALGVFPVLPQRSLCLPLFEERFVGIARKGHPAVTNGAMSVEEFAALPHALMTTRRDAIGQIDKVLARYNLKRRIALTIPHMLVLPFVISSSDLVSSVPSRVALRFANISSLEVFELPVESEPWTVSMIWSTLTDKDDANSWLRQAIKTACQPFLNTRANNHDRCQG